MTDKKKAPIVVHDDKDAATSTNDFVSGKARAAARREREADAEDDEVSGPAAKGKKTK